MKSLRKPALAQEHSPTSRAAAAAIEPVREPLKARVYRWIAFMGSAGCTDEEGCLALDMNPSTYRPRRVELVEEGSVIDSSTTRRTRSGRAAVVWIVRR